MKPFIRELIIVLSLLLVGTIIFRITDLDLIIQSLFYNSEGWYWKDLPFSRFIYDYANIPAFVIFFGSVLLLVFGYLKQKYAIYRKISFFLILIMLLGPGLIVNGIFKEHWGRPRPRQVIEFGGSSQYLPIWQKGESGAGNSFPSGHASIGFYLFVLFFIFRKKNPKLAYGSLLFAILFGALVGFFRIVQGGHFASDVIWAAGFVYLSCLIFYKIFRLDIEPSWSDKPLIKVNRVAFSFVVLILVIFYLILVMGFMRYPKLATLILRKKMINQIDKAIPTIDLNISENFNDLRKEQFGLQRESISKRITVNEANPEYIDIYAPVVYWDPSLSMQP